MNKFDKYLVTYVKYTSLVFILFMIWASEEFKDLAGLQEANASGGWWNVFGAFFIVWVLGIFYIVIKMLFSKSLRNIIMSKMAGIKERDERESLVAGSAAKFSFLSTFAILLFFLLFSTLSFTFAKGPKNTEGKSGYFSIGLELKLYDSKAVTYEKVAEKNVYKYNTIPLTTPLILLLIMFWQLGSYHLVARRELREE